MPNAMNLLERIVKLGERQLGALDAATDILCTELRHAGIAFDLQTFSVTIPRERSAVLLADGKRLPCAATSFTSGTIEGKDVILSSAMAMAESPDIPNINVNPSCPAISRGNHYRAPAVAVSHATLALIFAAKTVRVEVAVDLVTQEACNILLGNAENPATLLFTHFDSIGPGANDNASGVAAVFRTIIDAPELLERTLVILSGAEELSTDTPFYWGAGYRRFQEAHPRLMHSAQNILVVDSVGNGNIAAITDPATIRRAFPIHDLETLGSKIRLLTGDLNALMTVYHSALDLPDRLSDASLAQGQSLLRNLLAAPVR